MHLDLPFSSPWVVKHGPDGQRVAIGTDLVVTFGSIALDIDLARDLPAGTRCQVLRTSEGTTVDGWPLQLVDADVLGASGHVEARLYACYTLLAHAATAIARAETHGAIEAQRSTLVAVFERGRPAWRTPAAPICLADTWDLGAADLLAQRGAIRALYAAGRTTEGDEARAQFRTAWAQSRDPRVALVGEYVFDRSAADGFEIEAIETLRPADRAVNPILVFRAVRDDRLLAAVSIETSAPARAAQTPFIVTLTEGTTHRVVGAHAALPSYTQLAAEILPLLTAAVRAISG